MLKKYFTISYFTLFVALCISTIAAWYSVIGLTAIFAAAATPIMIMGTILEVAKVTTTVWLHHFWDRAGYAIRTYLTVAVVTLACLTSMGIFGLLSKAHLDQAVPASDVAAKLEIINDKIVVQQDLIKSARQALSQMDAQVNTMMDRGTTERSAERSVQIRRQQAGERAKLQRDIEVANDTITTLRAESAPYAATVRKLEAEVGPIRYIAALIYGDNAGKDVLERAVRFVTILIVIVFDPLAIVMILAANTSIRWEREKKPEELPESVLEAVEKPNTTSEPTDIDDSEHQEESLPEIKPELHTKGYKDSVWNKFAQLSTSQYLSPIKWKRVDPTLESEPTPVNIDKLPEPAPEPINEESQSAGVDVTANPQGTIRVYHPDEGNEGFVNYIVKENGVKKEQYGSLDAVMASSPELVLPSSSPRNVVSYGPAYPKRARKGDIHVITSVVPHKPVQFDGKRWIYLSREANTEYLQNVDYLNYLISKIEDGTYAESYVTQDEIYAIQRLDNHNGK